MQISQSALGPVSLLLDRLLLWDAKKEGAHLMAEVKGSLATGGHYAGIKEEEGPKQPASFEMHWK